jgi:hypothetical protein
MFSVDNFYTIFNDLYALPNSANQMLVFDPHGSKFWDQTKFFDPYFKDIIEPDLRVLGCLVMHDQEPFFVSSLSTYKFAWLERKKKFGPLEYQKAHLATQKASDWDLLHLKLGSGLVPILCHSELNSQDISLANENLLIDCFYWWHGMIARDWFRHWQHHPRLVPADRSQARFRFLLYARAFDGTRSYRKQIVDFLREYKAMTLFDWYDTHNVDSNASASINVDDANLSSIQLVAETVFDDKIYLTEKIFKPMVMSQPFILYAAAGSLKFLRRYGFLTFDSVWDESYDDEIDSQSRMIKIQKLISDLAGLNSADFSKLYLKCLDIVEHNRNHFFSPEFQDTLMTEMRNNMNTALSQQKELQEVYPGGSWINLYDRWHRSGILTGQMQDLFRRTMGFYKDRSPVTAESIIRRYPNIIESI